MTFDHSSLSLLAEALQALEHGFDSLPSFQAKFDVPKLRAALLETATKLQDNYPYHHPLYVGQMLKPPHPAARLAYALAMFLNPNNHALDGSRASSPMEKEAVAELARLFGWKEHLGHLTSGGTFANLEALWIARETASREGQRPAGVAASAQAHYTHSRVPAVLGMPFRKIAADPMGRMDLGDLEAALRSGEVGTVVATMGTTAAGTVDPLPDLLALRRKHGFRLHIDAAYGGYFGLAGNLAAPARAAFDLIGEADSIVIDPHKHGLQPYGCGCVLFRDPAVGRHYRHDSPYTYFTSDELHLGEISLECSRPGAAAVALWTTLRLLPLVRGGEFAKGLEAGREAALGLHRALRENQRFAPLMEPELDIVVWAVRARTATEASDKARQLFDAAAQLDLHLALAAFPRAMAEAAAPVERWDADAITCLRACAMKPEHRDWLPEILKRLDAAAQRI